MREGCCLTNSWRSLIRNSPHRQFHTNIQVKANNYNLHFFLEMIIRRETSERSHGGQIMSLIKPFQNALPEIIATLAVFATQ